MPPRTESDTRPEKEPNAPESNRAKLPSTTGFNRYGRPAMVGMFSAKIATPILDKRGFASGAVITRWPEIVGAELAAFAVPLEIKFPRHRNDKATLVLQVANGSAATLLQMKAPVLVDRVNAFLGYAAIARIEAQQGPLPRRTRAQIKPEPVLNAAEESDIEQKIKNVVAPDLRVALQKLGSAIARRSHDHDARHSRDGKKPE